MSNYLSNLITRSFQPAAVIQPQSVWLPVPRERDAEPPALLEEVAEFSAQLPGLSHENVEPRAAFKPPRRRAVSSALAAPLRPLQEDAVDTANAVLPRPLPRVSEVSAQDVSAHYQPRSATLPVAPAHNRSVAVAPERHPEPMPHLPNATERVAPVMKKSLPSGPSPVAKADSFVPWANGETAVAAATPRPALAAIENEAPRVAPAPRLLEARHSAAVVAEPFAAANDAVVAPAVETLRPLLQAPAAMRLPVALAAPPAAAAPMAVPAAEQVVQVNIGRIEIRATPAPVTTTSKSSPSAPVMGLDDYLRQRARGGKR